MAFFSSPLTAVLKRILFNTAKNSQRIQGSVRSTQLAGDPLAKKKKSQTPKTKEEASGNQNPRERKERRKREIGEIFILQLLRSEPCRLQAEPPASKRLSETPRQSLLCTFSQILPFFHL